MQCPRWLSPQEAQADASAILDELAGHAVNYVLIGGLAVQAHGHLRTTQDVDVYPAADPENLGRLVAALKALDARPAGSRGRELRFNLTPAAIEAAGTLPLDTRAGGVDIHLSPPGAACYEQVRKRALEIELAGGVVAVAGRDDLIAMERASGRPLDRGDVIALTAADRPADR